jgi:hypothetical protein
MNTTQFCFGYKYECSRRLLGERDCAPWTRARMLFSSNYVQEAVKKENPKETTDLYPHLHRPQANPKKDKKGMMLMNKERDQNFLGRPART